MFSVRYDLNLCVYCTELSGSMGPCYGSGGWCRVPFRASPREMFDEMALWGASVPKIRFSPVSIIPPILLTDLILKLLLSEEKRAKPGNPQ